MIRRFDCRSSCAIVIGKLPDVPTTSPRAQLSDATVPPALFCKTIQTLIHI